MDESRIATTDRLRKAGLWEAACAFREQCRLELRAEGKSRQDANDQAWAQMQERFPAPAVPPRPNATEELVEDIQRRTVVAPSIDELIAVVSATGSSANLLADIFWARQHLDDPQFRIADAPTPAAKFFAELQQLSPSRLMDVAVRYVQLHPSALEG